MSMNILNRRIHVIVLDTPEQGSSKPVMETYFKCNLCKHSRECQTKGEAQCLFAAYLTHKLPTTLYSLKDTKPTVEIHTHNPDQVALDNIAKIVERAKRLRMSGAVKSNYKKR